MIDKYPKPYEPIQYEDESDHPYYGTKMYDAPDIEYELGFDVSGLMFRQVSIIDWIKASRYWSRITYVCRNKILPIGIDVMTDSPDLLRELSNLPKEIDLPIRVIDHTGRTDITGENISIKISEKQIYHTLLLVGDHVLIVNYLYDVPIQDCPVTQHQLGVFHQIYRDEFERMWDDHNLN